MCSIILCFHTHNYAISTDIEKAFLHINLHKKDRDCTRFFWLKNPADPNSEFVAYQFKSVFFRVVSLPFILYQPQKHPLTALIIYSIHVKLYHVGINSTVTALRLSYWVPAARQYVKSLLPYCTVCKRHNGRSYPAPDSTSLPKSQDTPPFTVTGVDFTGALYVQQKGDEIKVYICLFTCATMRQSYSPRSSHWPFH